MRLLTTSHVTAIAAIALGLLLAVAIGVEEAWLSFKQTLTAVCGFIIGYQATRRNDDLRPFIFLLALIGLAYALVCVAALLGVSSTYLPVIYAYGFNNGVPVIRAELTTDQNYQIYYLLPIILGLILKQSLVRLFTLLFGVAASFYVIIMMETRSGLLLMLTLLAGIVLLPVWYKQKNSVNKVLALSVIVLLVALVKLPEIIDISQGMIRRFTESDLGTFWGRILSITYLFEHIYNPIWWVPKGQNIFLLEHGSFPHSTPTSIFLRAGILGLIGWLSLIAWPVVKAAVLIHKRRINIYQATIVFGATISLIASFSLPAAMFEQVWLWGGASWGIIEFNKSQRRKMKKQYG